ncbi:MAG: carbohydrate kinase family protein [Gemmatimonadetes bacterium]|nr:carbohydrate kinase family protein [Gemmatimonadota bacterium]MYD26828.1 carbohydrate kinase family protein [Gemmatimonadota bacterium]MYI99021.1 carbohydrate kinase family protein [Gemmatimonadota bacterium]
MRVGIIGLINHDTIFMAGGRRIQDLGGILYNTTVMADLVGEGDALYPISRIGTDCYDAMRAMLDPRPAVSNRGVRVSRTGTSRNRIRYDEDMEKVEQLTNHIGPIPFEQIEPFLDLDALLVNFIVGDDISLETMAAVRERATGLLYLDVHNLCLGIDAEGYRRRRAPGDWHRWIEMFDVVQMNEVEARLLAGVPGAGDQAAGRSGRPSGPLEAEDDFIAFGRSVTALGPTACVITRGPLGPVTVYRTDGETRVIAIPSEPVREVVDTTGCGDAFAAGFVVEYAATKNPVGATRLANRVASVNCTVAGLPEPGTFSDIRS